MVKMVKMVVMQNSAIKYYHEFQNFMEGHIKI